MHPGTEESGRIQRWRRRKLQIATLSGTSMGKEEIEKRCMGQGWGKANSNHECVTPAWLARPCWSWRRPGINTGRSSGPSILLVRNRQMIKSWKKSRIGQFIMHIIMVQGVIIFVMIRFKHGRCYWCQVRARIKKIPILVCTVDRWPHEWLILIYNLVLVLFQAS